MTRTIDFGSNLSLSLAPATREEELTQSIFIVLNTYRGEVPCYREFGIDSTFLHRPINAAKTLYVATVTEAIERFVPGVRVNRVSFADGSDSPTTLCPILEVTFDE